MHSSAYFCKAHYTFVVLYCTNSTIITIHISLYIITYTCTCTCTCIHIEYLVFDKETENNENYSQNNLIIPQPVIHNSQ